MASNRFYQDLENIYNRFNKQLFDDSLPPCIITLQRSKKFAGYHLPGSFEDVKKTGYDEICLNPELFLERTTVQVLSTLVHEMCHVWQSAHGKPGRKGYHNSEWVKKMLEVGLKPLSATTGWKGTGQKVTHEIDPNGAFQRVIDIMGKQSEVIDFKAVYFPDVKTVKAKQKTAYCCPLCDAKVWGKPGMKIMCGEHEETDFDMPQMIEQKVNDSEV